MTRTQGIHTLAELAQQALGDSLFARIAFHEARAAVFRETDPALAADSQAIADELRSAEARQQRLFSGESAAPTPTPAQAAPPTPDHDLESAVHEDFAEHCRQCASGLRKPMDFAEYRRLWLAGWTARGEADPHGKAHDSQG